MPQIAQKKARARARARPLEGAHTQQQTVDNDGDNTAGGKGRFHPLRYVTLIIFAFTCHTSKICTTHVLQNWGNKIEQQFNANPDLIDVEMFYLHFLCSWTAMTRHRRSAARRRLEAVNKSGINGRGQQHGRHTVGVVAGGKLKSLMGRIE